MATVEGGDKLSATLHSLGERYGQKTEVRMGFLEKATYPDGTPVATVAMINNYGAPAAGIPPRPFFTQMVQEKGPHWGEQFATILASVQNNTDKALELLGEGMAAQLREAIVAFNSVPNSPVTDLLKQRFPDGIYEFSDVLQAWEDIHGDVVEYAPAGKPLVWSGHLLNSIDKEVL